MERLVVDVRGCAELLGMSVGQVYTYVESGVLPHNRIGKHIRFRVRSLENWLEQTETVEWRRGSARRH
jgi:excisionase family DNA binding protein